VAVHKGNPGRVRQSFCGVIIYVEACYLASIAKGQEEKGMTEDEMLGWHHRLHASEF